MRQIISDHIPVFIVVETSRMMINEKLLIYFFNGQLRGSKKFYSNLIEKQEGDIYCADGGANIAYQ